MSGKSIRPNLSWTPDGWNDYNELYPNTPALPESSSTAIGDFLNIWERPGRHNFGAASEVPDSGKTLFVLVRGIFGNLMPGNFIPVLKNFRAKGFSVIRPRTYVVGTVATSAARLLKEVRPHLRDIDRIVWLCQSRGGLDALLALSLYPELRDQTAGAVLVQTPSAASAIMQSILTGDYAQSRTGWRPRVAENMQKAIFTLPMFRDGCEELMSPGIDECVATLQHYEFPFPVLAVATWSVEPTSWVDSYHKRLGAIRPGCAHDGQFYLQDQLWHFPDQLVLGRIDHAQSVMGGNGFDLVRFWTTLTTMLLEGSVNSRVTRNPTHRTQSSIAP